MRKIKGLLLLTFTIGLVALGACDKPEINIGNPMVGVWILNETCINDACVSPDPGTTVTLEFRANDWVEKLDDQVTATAGYTVITAQNVNNVTTYEISVNNSPWLLEVRETTMEIFDGLRVKRLTRQQ